MRLAELRIVTDHEGRFNFYPIGDLHLDRTAFQYARFKAWRKKLIEDPYGVGCFVGDAVEGRTPGMKHFNTSTLTPAFRLNMDRYVPFALDKAESLLKPITEAGRPLIVVSGNHDDYMEFSGFSAALADRVKATYLGGAGMVRIYTGDAGPAKGRNRTGRRSYCTRLYVTHGSGGGVLPGGKINSLQRLREVCDADIYLAGHVHDQAARVLKMPTLNVKGPLEITWRHVGFLRAAAFLDQAEAGVDGYDQKKAYPMTDTGLVGLNVYPRYRRMKRFEAAF